MNDPVIERYCGLEQWSAAVARGHIRIQEEITARDALVPRFTQANLRGRCAVCAGETSFSLADYVIEGTSFREHLSCAACGSISRQRAVVIALEDVAPQTGQSIYVTEQATPFYVAMYKRFTRLRGSEFVGSMARRVRLGVWLWRQGIRESLHFEDVTSLSFSPARHEAVISMDVLEHVFDYAAALREFARVLRPGGVLVLTVPFYWEQAATETIAWRNDEGGIEHAGEPEYHGDPVSPGVLCFHHFGWDLLDKIREAGFSHAEALRVRAQAQGVPEPVWVLRAIR